MPCLSLRGTISALTACCVAIVAIITLSITLTTSLSALRDIGKTHAAALLANARLQTEDLFQKPARATAALRNITMSSTWNWPSDDPTVLTMFQTLARDQFLTCGVECVIGLFFYDSTRFTMQVAQFANLPQPEYGGDLYLPAPYSIGGIEYQRTQPIQWVRQSYYQSNHHVVAADDPSWTDTPPTPNLVRDTAFWNTSLIPATFGATAITMPGVYLVVFGGVASNYIPTIAPLYTYGAKKSPNNVYAYSTVTLDTGGITLFLKSVGGTVNTASFAYDGAGFLVGSSLNKSFETLTSSTNAKTLASGPGCATTAATDGVVSTADTLSYSSCRTHISAYGYAPLATLASDTAFIFYQGNAVQLLTMGSDVYYAAVAQVALPYPGIGIWVVLVMPEADVIGDVVTGRNTAIGITCGVFVVVACLSFALISLLLRPLTTIADRMMLAASLEDDGDDEKELSSMAEVEDLQQAYYAMNDELIRIRSFVPQTVLKTKRAVVVIDDTTEEDTKSNVKSPSHSIHSRMPQGSTRSGISKRSSHRSLANGLNVACGLASQTVSVVVANLNRFDAAVNDASRDLAVAGVADTVKMVYDVVAAQKGVVQSFHGDHFMASFNAVTPCAAHARRAAVAALHLVREARSVGLKLGMRAGVGTGRCLVGNLGSADAKSFSTIGSAFVHANVMERLTRVYGDGCHVLAAKRTCVDIATHVRYRFVDVVQLPRMKGPTLIGALLEEVDTHDEHRRGGGGNDGEWLYVVENETGADNVINTTFVALADGKLDVASKSILNIDQERLHDSNVHCRIIDVHSDIVTQGLSQAPCRDLGLLYRVGFDLDPKQQTIPKAAATPSQRTVSILDAT